jgi:hypothetical protein
MNNNKNTNNKFGKVQVVPSLCEFYPGICLTTEEKAPKNLRQGTRRDSKYTQYQNTHPPTHTHTHHITKQLKTIRVQIKTNTLQDIPK